MDFEEIGQNVSSLFKNKWFVVAAVGVGLLGLLTWNRNKNKQAEAEEEKTEDMAVLGYTGFGLGGMSEEDYYAEMLEEAQEAYDESVEQLTDEFNTALTDQQNKFDSDLANAQAEYNKALEDAEASFQSELDKLLAQIEDMANQPSSSGSSGSKGSSSKNEQYLLEAELQADLAQMKANSELWWNVDSQGVKDSLHAENMAIADKWGFDYDSASGNYLSDGQVVYYTSKQVGSMINAATQPKTTTTTKTVDTGSLTKTSGSGSKSSTVSYDANVDYQDLINKAKASGASQSAIDQLNAQRQAKINALYGGVDPNTKK